MLLLRPILALLLTSLPAVADGTLEGRTVTLNVLTYDDPASPWRAAALGPKRRWRWTLR